MTLGMVPPSYCSHYSCLYSMLLLQTAFKLLNLKQPSLNLALFFFVVLSQSITFYYLKKNFFHIGV